MSVDHHDRRGTRRNRLSASSTANPHVLDGAIAGQRVIGPGSSCWNRAWCSRRRSSRSIPREATPRAPARRARCRTSSPRPTPIPTRMAARSSSIRRCFRRRHRRQITLGATLVLSETTGPEVIDGPGAGIAILSGNFSVGVFSVDSGVTASLSGLMIDSGLTTGNGGGLENFGAVTLSECLISGNGAESGAGVSNELSGTLTLNSCTIIGNVAYQGGGPLNGGGVINYGTAMITGCTIFANTATAGGGLWNGGDTATMTVADCTITGNHAIRRRWPLQHQLRHGHDEPRRQHDHRQLGHRQRRRRSELRHRGDGVHQLHDQQ